MFLNLVLFYTKINSKQCLIEFFVVKCLKTSLIIINSKPEYVLFLTIPSQHISVQLSTLGTLPG